MNHEKTVEKSGAASDNYKSTSKKGSKHGRDRQNESDDESGSGKRAGGPSNDAVAMVTAVELTDEEKLRLKEKRAERLKRQRLLEAQRAAEAKEGNDQSGFPMPSTKAQIAAIPPEGRIFEGQEFGNKNSLTSHVMCVHEYEKRRFIKTESRPLSQVFQCAFPNCTFKIVAGYRTSRSEPCGGQAPQESGVSGMVDDTEDTRPSIPSSKGKEKCFAISKFIPHSCQSCVLGSSIPRPGAEGGKNQYFSPHALTAPALVPVVVPHLMQNQQIPPSLLRPLVMPFLHVQPSAQFLSKLKKLGCAGLAKTPDDDANMAQQLCEKINQNGDFAVVETITGREAIDILVNNARLDHALAIKHLKKQGKQAQAQAIGPFDPSSVDTSHPISPYKCTISKAEPPITALFCPLNPPQAHLFWRETHYKCNYDFGMNPPEEKNPLQVNDISA